MTVLNLDLWKTYLAYVRETKDKQANYREKMSKAYEFALEKIGLDLQRQGAKNAMNYYGKTT